MFICTSEIKFLGHKVGEEKHFPDNDTILAIKQLKRPVTKKDMKSVLGLISFYRSCIPNYADIAMLLNELSRGRKSGEVL